MGGTEAALDPSTPGSCCTITNLLCACNDCLPARAQPGLDGVEAPAAGPEEPLFEPRDWAAAFTSQPGEFEYWVDEVEGRVPDALTGTLFRNGPGNFGAPRPPPDFALAPAGLQWAPRLQASWAQASSSHAAPHIPSTSWLGSELLRWLSGHVAEAHAHSCSPVKTDLVLFIAFCW